MAGSNPGLLEPGGAGLAGAGPQAVLPTTPVRVCTPTLLKALGVDPDASDFREMGFSIEKVTVTAKSRALRAQYSMELASRPQGYPRSKCLKLS